MNAFNEVIPRVYQGKYPPPGDKLRRLGVDVLVLCSTEHQDPPSHYPAVTVVHAPMVDCDVIPVAVARRAAHQVAQAYLNHKTVLVTCHMGLNRSGLVTALALRELGFGSGRSCANHVRRHRRGALFNKSFYDWLCGQPAR